VILSQSFGSASTIVSGGASSGESPNANVVVGGNGDGGGGGGGGSSTLLGSKRDLFRLVPAHHHHHHSPPPTVMSSYPQKRILAGAHRGVVSVNDMVMLRRVASRMKVPIGSGGGGGGRGGGGDNVIGAFAMEWRGNNVDVGTRAHATMRGLIPGETLGAWHIFAHAVHGVPGAPYPGNNSCSN
jgi:hypothetical protein